MCGIVGVITSCKNGMVHKDLEIFEDLLYVDALRGFDSTGVFTINTSGNLDWGKGAVAPYAFLQNKVWKSLKTGAFRDGLMMFGHNRKATEGNINNNNAHPFVEGNTTLIHNGSLQNWRSLMRHDKREKHGIQVDSHVIAYLFEHENYLDVLKEVVGAYVFIWYNAKERVLRIARNEERPLHWGKEEKSGSYFFASEGNMLRCIANRRMGSEIKVAHMLKEGLVHTYTVDTNGGYSYEGTEEVPQAKKSVGVVVTAPVSTTPTIVAATTNLRKVVCAPDQNNLPKTHGYVPPQYQNNIYYGTEPLESIMPYQRTVFIIDDYDYVAKASNHFIFTGFVVGSPKNKIRGSFSGEENDLLALMEVPIIGFIKRIGTLEDNKKIIIVQSPEKCEVVEMAKGGYMEKGHFTRMLNKNRGNCFCQVNIDLTRTQDLCYLPPDKGGDTGDFMCLQCIQFDEQTLAAATRTADEG